MEKELLEQDIDAGSNLISPKWGGNKVFSANIHVEEKKLRLFGFEVDPYSNDGRCSRGSEQGDESVNSSTTVLSRSDQKPVKVKSPLSEMEEKKYECQFCFKEFANSQALGGHQNAHKKERQKKKRLQLQARKASINRYLQPFQSPHGFNYYVSPQFYETNSYVPEFTVLEEPQISFNPYNQNAFPHRSLVSNSYSIPSHHVPIQQDTCKFNLIQTHGSNNNRPAAVTIKPSPLPISNQNCKSLDLQLSLTMQSNICSSSRSGV